jgi:NRPS condensation-like uncharacterized protein
VSAVTTTRLNTLDELYLHLDRDDEPWSVHVEVRVSGRVDAERLRTAARTAAARHPLARARLVPGGPVALHHEWEIAGTLTDVDLAEVDCAGADELALARESLLNRTPSLDRPGPFALLLAHHPDGDVVGLNLHHAAGDGLSALRLMGSIARAYAGEPDPVPAIDPLAVRDVGGLSAPGSVRERMARGLAALDYLARGTRAPARLARATADDDAPGYGFALAQLSPSEVARLAALRTGGATVNDVLLGALAVAVRRFNDQHGAPTGEIYLMMPVNLRPAEWRHEVVGNFASYVSVRVSADDHGDLEGAIAAAAESTRRIKDGALAGVIVELFGAPLVPNAIKQRMPDLIPLTRDLVVDTAVLSNLGRVGDVPSFGDAGAVTELWFSPPGRMPLGASLGAATLGERMFLTLRHRRAQFDAEAAAEFLATYRQVLLT